MVGSHYEDRPGLEGFQERVIKIQIRNTERPRKACAVVLEQHCPGIVLGGSGIGEAIAANKVRGIRAARCCTVEDATLSRQHNDANVISLGGRMLDPELAKKMVDAFLATDFEGGRHVKRIADLE